MQHYIAPIIVFDFVLGFLVDLPFWLMLVFVVVFGVGFWVVDLEDFAIFFGTDFVVVFVVDFGVDLFVVDLEVDFVVDFVLFVGVCFFALGSVLYSPKRESLAPTLLPKSPNSS